MDNFNGNVLQSKEKGANGKITRWAAAQGMVLLENRNQVLPLTTKKIALYGRGVYATVKGGVGSGEVSSPYAISIYQGFLNAGYEITSSDWVDAYASEYNRIQEEDTTLSMIDKTWSGIRINVPEPALAQADIMKAFAADTAIYVISRVAGEGKDRTADKGDYYLTDNEAHNLKLIANSFKNTIVVLNTCVIDTKIFKEIEGLDAILFMSLAGMEGGNALVDVLDGTVNPSGKLTDTWAVNYEDYPASGTFGLNSGDGKQVNYEEGIYVGYRYFDSFHINPAYEFGYGLSYTDFAIEVDRVSINAENITIRTAVKNTGHTYAGKEVVQIYISAPKGSLDKPYQTLAAFGKTDELKPGEIQTLSITFPVSDMSSYSEALAAWVLEKGDYLVRVGNSSRNTKVVAVINLDEAKIIEQLSNRLPLNQNFKDKTNIGSTSYSYASEESEIAMAPVIELKAAAITMRNYSSNYKDSSVTTYLVEGSDYKSKYKSGSAFANENYTEKFETVPAYPNAKLYDVYCGKITMEQFVAQLDLKTLATIANGHFSYSDYKLSVEKPIEKAVATPGRASGSTTANFVNSLGIPNILLPDGPAGLHIGTETGCTAFPVGVLLAQTWDTNLIKEIGKTFGTEMLENNMTVLLGPGMNIHRDPLCGRNFEYYSEDPKLTGIVGSMITLGIQSHPGLGVAIKHFAANNQETERSGGNSSVSERALREIYLKGFEIAVKSAQPMTVMTSYNKINGTYTSSSCDLCTHILRGEWGFKGFVMTDWFTLSDNGQDMHAGNDIIMGGAHISQIINAITAPEPIFDADGSVNVTEITMFGGMSTNYLENWNSFLPGVDGKDSCCAEVAADIEVGVKVLEMVEKKIAEVNLKTDGSKTVIYKGTYKGAYITLGDLQKSVMNILSILLKGSTLKYVYNADTGYEPIEVKPYSSLFEDLITYLSVEQSKLK